MHTILTMSRGDSGRLEDWITYHSSIGFESFHILLDNPIDDSEDVARKLAAVKQLSITLEILPPVGEYFDEARDSVERSSLVTKWKKQNASRIVESGLPIVDPLSERQYLHFPPRLEAIREDDPEGWVSIIDVDEYIVTPERSQISELTSRSEMPRLRFRNFNFDLSDWDGRACVRRSNRRWSRSSIEAYGEGWQHRIKSLVRNEKSTPLASVHAISKGPFSVLPEAEYRLHHYKYPLQGVPIPYDTVDDEINF